MSSPVQVLIKEVYLYLQHVPSFCSLVRANTQPQNMLGSEAVKQHSHVSFEQSTTHSIWSTTGFSLVNGSLTFGFGTVVVDQLFRTFIFYGFFLFVCVPQRQLDCHVKFYSLSAHVQTQTTHLEEELFIIQGFIP